MRIHTNRIRAAALRYAVFTLCFALTGCESATPVPETTSEDAARQTLDKALDAWVKGEAIKGVKEASPSITVAEPKWEKGHKLEKYEVLGSGEPSGAERVFQVKLWLTDEGGKASQETVAYRVGTQPVLTVFRSLF